LGKGVQAAREGGGNSLSHKKGNARWEREEKEKRRTESGIVTGKGEKEKRLLHKKGPTWPAVWQRGGRRK